MKSFITLKIFVATFGIGGGKCPHCPPWASRLVHVMLKESESEILERSETENFES